jgi:hypothetical protein
MLAQAREQDAQVAAQGQKMVLDHPRDFEFGFPLVVGAADAAADEQGAGQGARLGEAAVGGGGGGDAAEMKRLEEQMDYIRKTRSPGSPVTVKQETLSPQGKTFWQGEQVSFVKLGKNKAWILVQDESEQQGCLPTKCLNFSPEVATSVPASKHGEVPVSLSAFLSLSLSVSVAASVSVSISLARALTLFVSLTCSRSLSPPSLPLPPSRQGRTDRWTDG